MKLRRNPAFGKALAPAENPEGRLDLLAVRLIEAVLKARYGVPSEATVSVDLLQVGEMISRRAGFAGFASLRPELERAAREYGIETEQTVMQLAGSLGLLRGPRAGVKKHRRAACTR